MSKLDIFARHTHYLDHLAPIWNKLPEALRGNFYLPVALAQYAEARIGKDGIIFLTPKPGDGTIDVVPPATTNPILTCGYGDMIRTYRANPERRVALMEHGVGQTFGTAAYADGGGGRKNASLILLPNQHVADRTKKEFGIPQAVIGCPKLDIWSKAFEAQQRMPEKPTIAIAFHHGGQETHPPEAGSAQDFYARLMPSLAKCFNVIGHAHPHSHERDIPMWKRAGVEFVPDFGEVMRRADLYVNDCSSTLFEFLVTGKPVIILNAPWFRKDKEFGIRFWDFSDVGPQVDHPKQLAGTIEQIIADPDKYLEERKQAVETLYPHLGQSAETAVGVLIAWVQNRENPLITIAERQSANSGDVPGAVTPSGAKAPCKTLTVDDIKNKARGVIYMAFGQKARAEMLKSMRSLRKAGCRLPVVLIGDAPVDGAHFIEWQGESPFSAGAAKNFQFLAGRVKPKFYELSPFERSMYVDCDTEFMADVTPGFGFLDHWDFSIAQERQAIAQLYNAKHGNWHHDLPERDLTVKEFGGNGWFPFVNSGLFFFRRGEAVKDLFERWYQEWKRFEGWDEQKALLRAMNKSQARILVLSETWNCPHREKTTFVMEGSSMVYHAYGQGMARTTVK